jgi:hypothetical protein
MLSLVYSIVSSLVNKSSASSDVCLVFPALVLGYYFLIVKSMTYQFLYRLKNLYDYRSLAAIVLIFPASYRRNLYDILVPTLISIRWYHNTHNSTMASAASPSPANTKMMRKITPWHRWLPNKHERRIATWNILIHQFFMEIIGWIGGWLLVGLGVGDIGTRFT